MSEPYLSQLDQSAKGILKEKGSRFLAYAFPVFNPEEIQEHLAFLRKQYYDARHHCYAYRLGKSGHTTFATDDGEPSHSAGAPILAAIRSEGLTNILVVVVRYFGGTKLGVRGLIEAYRGAALLALQEAERTLLIPMVTFSVRFGYEQTSDLNRLLHPFNLTPIASEYTDRCQLTFAIEKERFEQLEEILNRALFKWNIIHSD